MEVKAGDEVFKIPTATTEAKMAFIVAFQSAIYELDRVKVFGVPLDVTIAREKQPVPIVITKLVDHITKTATCIRHPGIFRVAGAKKEIEALRVSFDAGGEEVANLKLSDKNVFSLCDALKQYLRCLPEPLLGYSIYNPLVAIMKNTLNDEKERIPKIVKELKSNTPKSALVVLVYLIKFLSKVTEFSDENKMTASNLSIVFGPTLLWPEPNSLESAMDMPYVNGVIQILIENTSIIPL